MTWTLDSIVGAIEELAKHHGPLSNATILLGDKAFKEFKVLCSTYCTVEDDNGPKDLAAKYRGIPILVSSMLDENYVGIFPGELSHKQRTFLNLK